MKDRKGDETSNAARSCTYLTHHSAKPDLDILAKDSLLNLLLNSLIDREKGDISPCIFNRLLKGQITRLKFASTACGDKEQMYVGVI